MGEMELFIVKAKKNTYAAQSGKVDSSRKNSKDLAFIEGDYHYLDSYFGETDFSGEEIVYFKDRPVWSMNYYGKMLEYGIPEGFSETLREALQNVPLDMPFRGPKEYIRDKYRYTCTVEGNMDFFHGVENIYAVGKEVYRLFFHGGSIQ